ncbi:MAG TPA: EAL domain-containing protein [Clostridiaceae bacterium]|nr:EAL domain-containing protein [Clostridiaceae bacterium]
MANKRRNFLDSFIDRSIDGFGKERHVPLKITLYFLFFAFASFIHARYGDIGINGIISMLQAIVSVLIVFLAGKRGFYAAIVSGVAQMVMVIIIAFAKRDHSVLPGAIVPLGTIVMLYLILLYSMRLIRQMREVELQKNTMVKMNEELADKERQAKQQNEKLIEYNISMKENEQKLYRMVHYDPLTELPNRTKIADRIDLLISLLSQKSLDFAVVYFDLDQFKRINDSLNHKAGDQFLKEVAKRIVRTAHPDDMVGRLGGDEFIIIIQRSLDEVSLRAYAEAVCKSISSPITLGDHEVSVTASAGISLYPQNGNSSAELIKNAETAMYKAKEAGRNGVQFFEKMMSEDVMVRVNYENGLLSSIENGELFLVFQPQYHTHSQKIRGFEALTRWKSSKFGIVSPAQFIPLAEQVGFILPLGEWIMQRACLTQKKMAEAFGEDLVMSVNISPIQVMSPSFLRSVKRILKDTGCNPKHLEFEVTESVMITSVEEVIKVLDALRDMGIRVALDDFGTGYSSLKYLQQLPIHTLKIDKAFVDDMVQGPVQRLMVSTIVSMVHEMDIEVVAEGVDHPSQLSILRELQCDFIQGYIWGRPLSEADSFSLLHEIQNEKSKSRFNINQEE